MSGKEKGTRRAGRKAPRKAAREARGRAKRYTIKRKLEILARVRKEAAKDGGLSIGEVAAAEGCTPQIIRVWLRDKRYSSSAQLPGRARKVR